MARHAKDLDLVLHIGLHKTASTYIQNVLSARRYDLIEHGVLFPSTGMRLGEPSRTRDGAQSGHSLFTGRRIRKEVFPDLLTEVPPTVSTVLLSAEDFTHPRLTPEQHLELFGGFRTIQVILALRRQDDWIESYYKQAVDQHRNFETRSFGDYLSHEGPALMDFYTRFSPWRNMVGPENFHALSYDDTSGEEMCRRVLEVVGIDEGEQDRMLDIEVPRYNSVRAIDTLGLRLLNGYRLTDREIRDEAAREIYAAAPPGDIELMRPEMRQAIQQEFGPSNERIEAEWFAKPVPGLRFRRDTGTTPREAPSANEVLEYVDRVVAVADAARLADETRLAARGAATAAATMAAAQTPRRAKVGAAE